MSCNEFTNAIDRKLLISQFHLEGLEHLLGTGEKTDPVPIPIQAHFEGLVTSVVACGDQIAAGLWHLARIGAKRQGLDATFRDPQVSEASEQDMWNPLRHCWYDAAMLDVREIRRRASHLHYDKDARGPHYMIQEYRIRTKDVLRGEPIRDREILAYSYSTWALVRELAPAGIDVLLRYH